MLLSPNSIIHPARHRGVSSGIALWLEADLRNVYPYTHLIDDNKTSIEQLLPEDTLRGFNGQYLETFNKLRDGQGQGEAKGNSRNPADQLDFEFVLFASAVIDYGYIMGLIARFSAKAPGKATMSREELIGTLKAGEGIFDAAIAVR